MCVGYNEIIPNDVTGSPDIFINDILWKCFP